jgi:RimJ/RimL family protein N-acetyltransferase
MVRAAARCRVFGAPQPTLQAVCPGGAPVRLRPLRIDDVPGCVRACNDPDTVRYTTVPYPYGEADGTGFITGFAPTQWARGVEAIFAIADADDAFVGTMALRLRGDELTTPTGDVGYLVGPWARGHGYASTALRALSDWGFRELALHRIEWQAYVGNTASRATAQRAGFRVEGEHRQALAHRGGYEDAWLGARLATDLEA